jgi:hypothetical protein
MDRIEEQPPAWVWSTPVSPAPGFERTEIASQRYACVEASLIRTAWAAYTEASLIAVPFFKSRGFRAIRFEEIKIRSKILQRWVMRKSFDRA